MGIWWSYIYRETSNISRTLVGIKIVDHSCCNYIFILGLTSVFDRLDKDNSMTRRETLKFWDLVTLVVINSMPKIEEYGYMHIYKCVYTLTLYIYIYIDMERN